ncbi:MAG: MlaE family lipid ABC transporter permease subunit [Myxococcota bacterium]
MIALHGPLTHPHVGEARTILEAGAKDAQVVRVDLADVPEADSAGVALLSLFARSLAAAGKSIEILNASPELKRTLDLFPFIKAEAKKDERESRRLERLGETTSETVELLLEFLLLSADTVWFMIGGLFQRRGIRWREVFFEMSSMGSKALDVVCLISFLVGATMALQSAQQLRTFGANIFVVDLIGISMTRELGPLMAAIVVAGRSGSAVAAEIGTMVITEEIDALKTMGLHPTRFLVVPKVLAISLTQPLLTLLANFAGIFGGFLVAVLYLEVGADTFVHRLEQTLMLKDVITGLIKSIIFAQLIVSVGAICGLRTKGGADAVGRSTTTAVVAGIFAVITADAVASLVFYF